jgi:GntR family transcriptional repressor for pyruvate dehydrogenase complex
MNLPLEPITTKSLKEIFIEKFSSLILSGEFHIGQKLPSERDLAEQLGVSRPVVHEGLVHLESQGLVTMQPRKGTIVNDYRKAGSLTLLNTLQQYGEGALEKDFLQSMLQMRKLLEIENARVAAINHTEKNIKSLKNILSIEETCDLSKNQDVVALDFDFHHTIAISTGNMVYPLIINSFRQVYTNLTSRFFQHEEII